MLSPARTSEAGIRKVIRKIVSDELLLYKGIRQTRLAASPRPVREAKALDPEEYELLHREPRGFLALRALARK